jgi:epoxyqueuosine reductase
LVGITTAAPFKKAYTILKQRKKSNNLPDFMNENLKLITHPYLVLPSAQSIISVGMSYATEIPENEEAYISQYARGLDYHDILKKKLKNLVDFINSLVDYEIENKFYTDTGPLLEREFAKRAGLGWIGKNNNLINPKYGSYLFLGEIITSLKLNPSHKQIKNGCHDCNLCLQNCKGKALIKPYTLNNNKCISYLTQKKGILPEIERNKIDNYLWGCDDCQKNCPYNKNIPKDLHSEFIPVIRADLKKILNFKNNKLPKSWIKAPLSWRGGRILKRNALIIIKNKGYLQYIELVRRELNNSSPILRAYAIWALYHIDPQFKRKDLVDYYSKENDKIVLNEIKKII